MFRHLLRFLVSVLNSAKISDLNVRRLYNNGRYIEKLISLNEDELLERVEFIYSLMSDGTALKLREKQFNDSVHSVMNRIFLSQRMSSDPEIQSEPSEIRKKINQRKTASAGRKKQTLKTKEIKTTNTEYRGIPQNSQDNFSFCNTQISLNAN